MKKQILSAFLAITLAVTGIGFGSINASAAAADAGKGKYIADVYFAYAKTEEDAAAYLKDHGWEPVKGDFNDSKGSVFDESIAVVMGIKRTNKASEAITDMAVMNMKGGYSFPDYEALVNEKKAQIDEFIGGFLPAIREYRANYNGEGSSIGKARAELAHEALNRYIDGDPSDRYAKNDTGKPLGDLFLQPLKQEGNASGGDLQQILLESSGAAALAIETLLGFAADTAADTWTARLAGLSGDELLDNLEKYVPEAAGQNVSPSVAQQYLTQHFGDAARVLADQWGEINDRLKKYETFCTENDLWLKDGETKEAQAKRIERYFERLSKKQPADYDEIYSDFYDGATFYNALKEVPYAGEWGETLYDFFRPANGKDYTGDAEVFLPFAAALSEGQRSAVSYLPLKTLLSVGLSSEEGVKEVFKESTKTLQSVQGLSVYSGINRGIFRGGVALTSEALVRKNQGHDPFNEILGAEGVYGIATLSAIVLGISSLAIGITFAVAAQIPPEVEAGIAHSKFMIEDALETLEVVSEDERELVLKDLEKTENDLARFESQVPSAGLSTASKAFFSIGGALLIGAACVKAYQLYQYYQVEFTAIPTMIVDEADIVSYAKGADGKEVKKINFDQYVYYEVAKCNRQERGKRKDWQSGVEKYAEWGCGDAVDLNGDFGQQWLALYTVKNTKKGSPILADSLTLQFSFDDMPKGCSKSLHFFTMTNAADLGDTAYSYNNDKKGVYFFWDSDEKAVKNETASAFTGGHMALAGAGGIVLGALVMTLVFLPKKKKQEGQDA